MGLDQLLTPDRVLTTIKATCKRGVLAELASVAASTLDVDRAAVCEALMEREQLGSTGVGEGVAIPHGKVAGLRAVEAVFARLREPVDFDAVDDKPVDLVFLLLAPKDASAAHLKALAKVSRLLRDASVRDALRGAASDEALYAALVTDLARSHAA
ncbi:MAG: PTS IIA-like nitrogen regulatory protein PtsN [Pseudomonadota bacterium]